MRKLVVLGIAVVTLAGLLTVSAGADGSATVNATISTKIVSITADEDSVNYGTLMPGDTGKKPDPAFFTVMNNGTVAVDLKISGTGTNNWLLGSVPGENQFVHYFDTSPNFSPGKILTTTPQTLWDDVQAGTGSIDVHLMLDMPTETTHFTTQTASVMVIATES